jgi:hypothetical protein
VIRLVGSLRLRSGQSIVDDLLSFAHYGVQVSLVTQALRVDLVDVLGA